MMRSRSWTLLLPVAATAVLILPAASGAQSGDGEVAQCVAALRRTAERVERITAMLLDTQACRRAPVPATPAKTEDPRVARAEAERDRARQDLGAMKRELATVVSAMAGELRSRLQAALPSRRACDSLDVAAVDGSTQVVVSGRLPDTRRAREIIDQTARAYPMLRITIGDLAATRICGLPIGGGYAAALRDSGEVETHTQSRQLSRQRFADFPPAEACESVGGLLDDAAQAERRLRTPTAFWVVAGAGPEAELLQCRKNRDGAWDHEPPADATRPTLVVVRQD